MAIRVRRASSSRSRGWPMSCSARSSSVDSAASSRRLRTRTWVGRSGAVSDTFRQAVTPRRSPFLLGPATPARPVAGFSECDEKSGRGRTLRDRGGLVEHCAQQPEDEGEEQPPEGQGDNDAPHALCTGHAVAFPPRRGTRTACPRSVASRAPCGCEEPTRHHTRWDTGPGTRTGAAGSPLTAEPRRAATRRRAGAWSSGGTGGRPTPRKNESARASGAMGHTPPGIGDERQRPLPRRSDFPAHPAPLGTFLTL